MNKIRSRYDVVLVIPRLKARLASHRDMRLLAECFRNAHMIGCDAYYRHSTDIALVVVHIDIHVVTAALLARFHEQLQRTGISMLEPAKMSESDRDRFLTIYLPNQDIRVRSIPTPEDALVVLADRLGIAAAASPTQHDDLAPPSVRFRRGDLWQRGRLCRISEEGIYIATGGPPRLGDVAEVHVETSLGRLESSVLAVQVTPASTAKAIGVSGFGGRFQFKDGSARRASAPLLQAVQDVLGRVSPPPRRRDTRFPMRWPAFLATGTTTRRIHVRDVSRRGLLVELDEPIANMCDLLLPSDDRRSPMRLRTRVARTVARDSHGTDLACGVGVELLVPDDEDGERFSSFVERVGKRASTRIVVGASPERLDGLLAEFASTGYHVAGGGAPRHIFDRVVETREPPDLVIVDSSLRDGNIVAARSLQRALDQRGFQTLRVDGDEPAATRHLVDAALVA